MRPVLEDFARFARLESHVLSRHPELLFQQAANQPATSAPSRAAESARGIGRHIRPWLRWVNRPRERDPVLCTLPCDDYWVIDCTFTPDGNRILTASGALRLWDAETGALIHQLTGDAGTRFALAADGRRIATEIWETVPGSPRRFPKEVRVWDLETGDALGRMDHPGSKLLCLAFSPDGSRLAVGTEDLDVLVWNAETYQLLHRLRQENRPQRCAFAPGGGWLAVTAG
jgi:WD40 repeat protein